MKKFFREGFDTILKLMVTQLGMTMFGIMMVFTAYGIDGTITRVDGKVVSFGPMFLIVSIFSILFYLFLLYTHIWEKGAKDRIKVDSGRMKKQTLKGLYYSLVANSLNILLGLIMCITYFFCDFVNAPDSAACQIFGISNDIARTIQGMYNGLILYISPNGTTPPPILFLLIVLPALAVTAFGYYRGFSNKRFFNAKK